MARLLRLRSEEGKAVRQSFLKVHPIDLGVLAYLLFGLPVSLKFLPSPVSLFLLLAVIVGWIAWKRTR
jgi:hypothetical protein